MAQSDVISTGDQDIADSIPAGSSNIISRRLIMKGILSLPLILEVQLSVCGERMCTNTG